MTTLEDKVAEAFQGMEKGQLIKSSLTHEQEKKLREDFSASPAKETAPVA